MLYLENPGYWQFHPSFSAPVIRLAVSALAALLCAPAWDDLTGVARPD